MSYMELLFSLVAVIFEQSVEYESSIFPCVFVFVLQSERWWWCLPGLSKTTRQTDWWWAWQKGTGLPIYLTNRGQRCCAQIHSIFVISYKWFENPKDLFMHLWMLGLRVEITIKCIWVWWRAKALQKMHCFLFNIIGCALRWQRQYGIYCSATEKKFL